MANKVTKRHELKSEMEGPCAGFDKVAPQPQAMKSKQSKVPKADDDYREHGSLTYKSGNCPIPQNSARERRQSNLV